MDSAGAVESATITQARIAAGDDFKVDVVNGPTSLKVSVRGASLDARAFVKSILEGDLVRTNARRRISTSTPRSRASSGSNKQAITNMELTASRRGGETRLGSLRGRIGARRGDGDGKRRGNADHDVRRRRASPFRQSLFASRRRRPQSASCALAANSSAGEATLTDFVLRDEPAFRQLVSAAPQRASEEGRRRAVDRCARSLSRR